MKDIHFLYIIAVLAIIGISATFIGYATDRLPVYPPRQIGTTTSVNADSTNAEKGCGCCNEDLAEFKEFMEKRKRRKEAEDQKVRTQNIVLK
jgi:hypothetical protein